MFVLIYLRIHFYEMKKGESWDISPEKEIINVPVHKHSVLGHTWMAQVRKLCRYVMLWSLLEFLHNRVKQKYLDDWADETQILAGLSCAFNHSAKPSFFLFQFCKHALIKHF